MTKKKVLNLIITGLITITMGVLFTCGIFVGRQMKTKIIHINFENNTLVNSERVHKYDFIDDYMSDFIEDLCNELGDDSDLVVAHLLTENPDINWDAIHVNENGTIDIGGFQLNDYYLYKTFIPEYWKFDVEFNPFNPKHNAYIAICHIHYLNEIHKVRDDAIAAYNCGSGAVMNNRIPDSTKTYVQRVNKYYQILKGKNNA